jgi:hypothetical protein
MTDAGIPMGREQQAREVLGATPHDADCPENPKLWSFRNRRRADPYPCVCDRHLRAMLAFADTPPPAAAGDRSLAREAIARVIDPLAFQAWQASYDYSLAVGDSEEDARKQADWSQKKACDEALTKADAILALRTPEPNSGGEADHG